MYYTSQNKSELQIYLEMVNAQEGYNGTTQNWARIIKHHSKDLFAIKAHPNYQISATSQNDISYFYPEIDIL